MNANRPPVSVVVIACVYLAVGILGFIFHFRDLRHPDGISIEITEIVAIIAGAFMLEPKTGRAGSRSHGWRSMSC